MPAKQASPVGAPFRNWKLKLIALLLGIIGWYWIREEISHQMEVTDIPIAILVDEGWAVLDRSVSVANVVFRGAEEAVLDLTREKVRVEVDLRGMTAPNPSVRLGPDNVQMPRGVRPVEVKPSLLMLSLDQERSTNLPVRATIQGEPPKGYEVESIVCTPATAQLFGPGQRLVEVSALSTAPLDVEGRVHSLEREVVVEPPDSTWGARVKPRVVKVRVSIVERAATQTVEDVPVRVLWGTEDPMSVDLYPTEVTVQLQGQDEVLGTLDAGGLVAYVDCGGLTPDAAYELPVRVDAPAETTVRSVDPAVVKTTLRRN